MSAEVPTQRSALAGVWIVNTRSPGQAQELNVLLEQRGAHPLSYPCIDIAPILDPSSLDRALEEAAAGEFDWLVFTSANAVEAVQARLEALKIPAARLAGTSVAAIGTGTAAVLEARLGMTTDLRPGEYVAEALAEELVARRARRVLVPQAEKAREALVRVLTASGTEVEAVTAYRTVLGSGGVDVPKLVHEGRVDAVVFASPSAVENMSVRFTNEGGNWDDLSTVCVACIGPVTSAAAEKRGLRVQVAPKDHTLRSLVDGLEHYYDKNHLRNDSGMGEPVS